MMTRLSEDMFRPSLNQVMVGSGTPDARQLSAASFVPAIRVILLGLVCIVAGSVVNAKKEELNMHFQP